MKAFEFYLENDKNLFDMMEKFSVTGGKTPVSAFLPRSARKCVVRKPDERYAFLHEAAVFSFKGKLFAAWYCCPRTELHGEAAILFCVSSDGGRTWGEEKLLITDLEGKILYCPPIFAEEDGALYMLVNEMVAPDYMHALDIFRYDEKREEFAFVSSTPLPFKLNTNPERLENGKWLFPGRIGELDKFPVTPAVAIAEKLTGEWKIVKMQKDGILPDGISLVHPECTAIVRKNEVFIFCRNDKRQVPIGYYSRDFGESFVGPFATDLPFVCSKIYAGRLSDGRYYVVGNTVEERDTGWGTNRTKLSLFVSKKDEWVFDKEYVLFNGDDEDAPETHAWHYPACAEADGELHIIFSVNYGAQKESRRGASIISVPIKDL